MLNNLNMTNSMIKVVDENLETQILYMHIREKIPVNRILNE